MYFVFQSVSTSLRWPRLGPCRDLQCGAHPGQALGYWCRQDAAAVCAHCLIFEPHRGHDAAPVEEELRALQGGF